MAVVHGSAAAILWLLSGCSGQRAREIALPLRVHQLQNRPVSEPALLDLAALGDFPTSNRTSESLSLSATDAKLDFPEATLALDASARPEGSDQVFIGHSERVADGLDVLLWPKGSACELFRPGPDGSYPGKLGGEALGYAASNGLVIVAGSNDATSAAIVGALTFDTHTGESHLVDPRQRAVLSEPRAFASASDFEGKVLVAGGENPIHDASVAGGTVRDSAEVYDPKTQSFELNLLKLAVPRTHHAAATLNSGETVLIGGRAEDSDASSFVEVVSPGTRVSKLVENLYVGRSEPSALRLSDGRILVAGGTDADGRPVGALEWRAADASRLDAPFDGSVELPPRFDRAYVALPGGAALAVGGCEDRSPLPDEDCAVWCVRGCPPIPDGAHQASYEAYWITAKGTVSKLDFPSSAAQPVLLPGSDGQPWLVTVGVNAAGEADAGSSLAYRFDPWQSVFQSVDLDLGAQRFVGPPRFVATGLDAFVWFGEDALGPALHGARLGTRSAFSSDVALVTLRDSEDAQRPAHLVPDQPPAQSLRYDSTRGVLHFETASSADAAPCVWISDADFADFSAQIAFSSRTPPMLRFGEQRFLAPSAPGVGATCRLPADSSTEGSIRVQRSGSHVSLSMGAATSSCELGVGRLPIGVCGSELGSSEVTAVSVTRGG
jgi:hypothetical protein